MQLIKLLDIDTIIKLNSRFNLNLSKDPTDKITNKPKDDLSFDRLKRFMEEDDEISGI